MNFIRPFIRFTDLCAQGQIKGQRIFIRADLNVPQDDAGNITEDTRIRASMACIQLALDSGAAVVWNVLGFSSSFASMQNGPVPAYGYEFGFSNNLGGYNLKLLPSP